MSEDNKKTPKDSAKSSSTKKPVNPVKSRTSNHHPDEEPTFNTVLEPKDRKQNADKAKPQKAKTGISHPSGLFLALMAALAGGAIGWGGPMLFGEQGAKTDALQVSLEQTRSDLSAAKSEQGRLASILASIQGTSRNQATSNQSIIESLGDLQDQVQALKDTQPVDTSEALAVLEERVSTLATLTLPVDDAGSEDGISSVNILDLMERLDALEAGGSADVTARLAALETQVEEYGVKPVAFPKPDATPIELPPAETPQSAEDILQVLVDTFPRAKMLETVRAQEVLAAKKPSWLQRALSRHVKTHNDENSTHPADTIDAAQAALKTGDINQSLILIATLNPPVRAVAAEWIDAANKAAKLIEKDL